VIWEIDETTRAVEGVDARGRAIPEYAAALGLRPARVGQRVLATFCEIAVGIVLLLPLLVGALPALVAAAADPQRLVADRGDLVLVAICAAASSFLVTAFVVVQLVLHGRLGLTLGKLVAGVRSVNVRTLERPGFWRGAVVRYLVMWASFLVPLIGPVLVIACSPLWDPERRGRGWPDLAGATWFVDARGGLNPYDAKRMRIARKAASFDVQDAVPVLPSLATPSDPAVVSPAAFPIARSTAGVLGAPPTGQSAASTAPGAAVPPAASVPPTASVPPAVAVPPAGSVHRAPPPAPRAAEAPPVSYPGPAHAPVVAAAEAWAPPMIAPPPPTSDRPADAPAGSARPASLARPAAVLVLDTGERIPVAAGRGVLIGRAPARGNGEDDLDAVAIADHTMSVSKTHILVRSTPGGLEVADRHSTNGSAVVRDGRQHELVPDRPTPVHDGDDIRFGDRRARVTTS